MLATSSYSNTKFRNDITFFENVDMHMEEINNFLTELELGSHILNGRLLALRNNSRISEIKTESSVVSNDSPQTDSSKLLKKLSAPSLSQIQRPLSDANSSGASYLRCGRIHSTLPLPKLASDDSSISIISNCHRRRSFSLGSQQVNTGDVHPDFKKLPE